MSRSCIGFGSDVRRPLLAFRSSTLHSSESVWAACQQGPKSLLGRKTGPCAALCLVWFELHRLARGPPASYLKLPKRDRMVRASQRVVAPVGARTERVSSDTQAAAACSAEGNVSRDPVHDSLRKQSIR